MQKRDEEFANLPEGAKLVRVCADARFTRNVSVGRFFVTRSAIELRGFGVAISCREYIHPRDEAPRYPKGVIGDNTEIDLALNVLVTKKHNRYGVELNID